jgi:hypothetical protein
MPMRGGSVNDHCSVEFLIFGNVDAINMSFRTLNLSFRTFCRLFDASCISNFIPPVNLPPQTAKKTLDFFTVYWISQLPLILC